MKPAVDKKSRVKTISLATMRKNLIKALWEEADDDNSVPIYKKSDIFKDIPKGARCN